MSEGIQTAIWVILSIVAFWWAGTSLVKRWQPVPVRIFGWVLAFAFVWPGIIIALIRWRAAAAEYQAEARNAFVEHWRSCQVCSGQPMSNTASFCDTGRKLLQAAQ
jgi:hypothetical protein